MKIKGFLKDVTGASRVTKARLGAFAAASAAPEKTDPIAEVARRWHPGRIDLKVTEVRPACKTAVTVRFVRADGQPLPLFRAGTYAVFDFKVGESAVSRPYSISSAPYEAQGENGYIEITVRRSKGDGFIADRINDEIKPGDILPAVIGCGQFYYEPLRDAKHVVALAGGVGITPFASMAKEIAAGGLEGVDLTILYGSVSSDDIVLREVLDGIRSERVHVVHVLSGEEPGWEGEKGFLTADLIRKYSAPDTSYFICGPQVMYTYLREELKKLEAPARRVRFEVFGQSKDISGEPGYPKELIGETFSITVCRGIHEDVIPAKASESIVTALERAGIRIETGCRSGECGFCRTKVLSGSVFVRPENDGRRAADKDFGYVHACAAYPTSDLKIRIPIE